MNKPVHLGLSILEFSKMLMNEFWYDYVNAYIVEEKIFIICIQIISLYT